MSNGNRSENHIVAGFIRTVITCAADSGIFAAPARVRCASSGLLAAVAANPARAPAHKAVDATVDRSCATEEGFQADPVGTK